MPQPPSALMASSVTCGCPPRAAAEVNADRHVGRYRQRRLSVYGVPGQIPDPVVRPATDRDLLGVMRVLDRRPDLPEDALSTAQRAAWQRMMATGDLTVYVAELDGEIVGTTSVMVMPHLTYDCHPTAFIEPMVVAETHRRRGVASAMLRRALADAKGANCRKVQVLSHKRHADDGAHELYRRVGFDAEAEGFRLYLG